MNIATMFDNFLQYFAFLLIFLKVGPTPNGGLGFTTLRSKVPCSRPSQPGALYFVILQVNKEKGKFHRIKTSSFIYCCFQIYCSWLPWAKPLLAVHLSDTEDRAVMLECECEHRTPHLQTPLSPCCPRIKDTFWSPCGSRTLVLSGPILFFQLISSP